jgi:hypothetical protein
MRAFRLALVAACALAGATGSFGAEKLGDCDDLQLDAFDFPATTLMTKGDCQKAGGRLCQALDHGMGHRTTSQALCYRDKTVMGGIRGTLKNAGP